MEKCAGQESELILWVLWIWSSMAFGCFGRRCDWHFICFPVLYILLLSSLWGAATANVVLIRKNVSLSFNDIEANFGKKILGLSEIHGFVVTSK